MSNKNYCLWVLLVCSSFNAHAATNSLEGKWCYLENQITIENTSSAAEKLHIKGIAIEESGNGAPHTADFDFTETAVANSIYHLDQNGCDVAMVLHTGKLHVQDNNQCGGMNVRFDGVYQRCK